MPDTYRTQAGAERPRRLVRIREHRLLGGVATGLALYTGRSRWLFRLAFGVLTALGAAGVVLYAAAWVLIPDETAERSIAGSIWDRRHERPRRTVALGLVVAAVVLCSPHAVALAALVAAAVLWLRDEPPRDGVHRV